MFGGKGGVGKTTTSSTTALHFASQGRRTLIISSDLTPSLSDIFETSIGATETPIPGARRRVAPAAPASSTRASAQALAALPDGQLVALATRGEQGALEQLYRRHAAFAIHLAARIEGSTRDVEDVVHDAFIRAFERLPDLADPAAFRAWLGAIVVHAVR